MTAASPTAFQGRLVILAAALLWSLSGAFKSFLTYPTTLGLHEPAITSMQIAFFRLFFAGLFLLPLLRRSDLAFRPAMLGMIAAFAVMNVLFVSALTEGQAANAILLQYTAPLWVVLAGAVVGVRPDRRGLVAVLLGTAGVGVIVWGGWDARQSRILGKALGSGVCYAAVLLFLGALRGYSSRYLTVLNHLGGSAVLLPLACGLPLVPGSWEEAARWARPWAWHLEWPTTAQLAFLAAFGVIQMGLPYWLMARGLQSVRPQEAGTLTLVEPLLNPLWAYLVAPDHETPTVYTAVGGAIVLASLAYRYAPRRKGVSAG